MDSSPPWEDRQTPSPTPRTPESPAPCSPPSISRPPPSPEVQVTAHYRNGRIQRRYRWSSPPSSSYWEYGYAIRSDEAEGSPAPSDAENLDRTTFSPAEPSTPTGNMEDFTSGSSPQLHPPPPPLVSSPKPLTWPRSALEKLEEALRDALPPPSLRVPQPPPSPTNSQNTDGSSSPLLPLVSSSTPLLRSVPPPPPPKPLPSSRSALEKLEEALRESLQPPPLRVPQPPPSPANSQNVVPPTAESLRQSPPPPPPPRKKNIPPPPPKAKKILNNTFSGNIARPPPRERDVSPRPPPPPAPPASSSTNQSATLINPGTSASSSSSTPSSATVQASSGDHRNPSPTPPPPPRERDVLLRPPYYPPPAPLAQPANQIDFEQLVTNIRLLFQNVRPINSQAPVDCTEPTAMAESCSPSTNSLPSPAPHLLLHREAPSSESATLINPGTSASSSSNTPSSAAQNKLDMELQKNYRNNIYEEKLKEAEAKAQEDGEKLSEIQKAEIWTASETEALLKIQEVQERQREEKEKRREEELTKMKEKAQELANSYVIEEQKKAQNPSPERGRSSSSVRTFPQSLYEKEMRSPSPSKSRWEESQESPPRRRIFSRWSRRSPDEERRRNRRRRHSRNSSRSPRSSRRRSSSRRHRRRSSTPRSRSRSPISRRRSSSRSSTRMETDLPAAYARRTRRSPSSTRTRRPFVSSSCISSSSDRQRPRRSSSTRTVTTPFSSFSSTPTAESSTSRVPDPEPSVPVPVVPSPHVSAETPLSHSQSPGSDSGYVYPAQRLSFADENADDDMDIDTSNDGSSHNEVFVEPHANTGQLELDLPPEPQAYTTSAGPSSSQENRAPPANVFDPPLKKKEPQFTMGYYFPR